MLPRSHNELSQKLQAALGIPEGMKMFGSFPFGGMNQQDARMAMEDSEFFLRENFVRIGKGNLRTVWDVGGNLYVAPVGKTIVYFSFFNIGATNYVAIFLSDGTAVQVNTATKINTPISTNTGTFYTGGQLPTTTQWGTQYLVIANNITPNSYWIWDGAILYSAGSLGPGVTVTDGGAGYTSPPTITAYGGSGSGATFLATISGGSVVSIQVTNPGTGYEPSDQVQLYITGGGTDSGAELLAVLTAGTIASVEVTNGGSGYSASPTISFTGGGGTGATATATVDGGVITAISITDPGSGYTGTPVVGIMDMSGTGASAQAFLSAGSVASVTVVHGGSGFTSTPTVTFVGGGGTGATGNVNLTSGSISSVSITNAGSDYTSLPAVVVQDGINNAASATVTLMPFGVSGAASETFQQRLWLTFPNQVGNQENGGTILVSVVGSLTDFSTSDGGLTYVTNSPFLRASYTNIKQSNGYLYPFGDSSVDVISNVQTSGSPTTTTFNYQNTDPQIGTSWRDSCANYSRTILFVNQFGVFGLYGGSVTKVSSKMDDIFTNAVFPPNDDSLMPCSAVADIFSQKVFMVLMTVLDPVTQVKRNVLVAWDEKDWMLLSQSTDLTFIATQEVNSDLTAWGTDGSKLFPLFNTPSDLLTKRLSTKLWGAESEILVKEAQMLVVQAKDNSVNKSGIDFSIATIDNEEGSYPMPVSVSLITPAPKNAIYSAGAANVVGCNLGVTLASNSLDFTLNYLGLGATDVSSIYGSQNINTTEGE